MKINKIKDKNLIKIIYLFMMTKWHWKNSSIFIEGFFLSPRLLPLGPTTKSPPGIEKEPRWDLCTRLELHNESNPAWLTSLVFGFDFGLVLYTSRPGSARLQARVFSTRLGCHSYK